ncbi:PTS glucose transporter subunit IIA [Metabacillus fastidiosus]|uniref:PTS sugar transporter subunit IIA n=1 Tax=Metabacillus fastidiosus TaxID=1458 RepID=UPI002DBC94E9|nr:PTS glucose transporter subunit IIA [Metabacillus fastidiosus]MEC2075879.1 PTS glucose transporter subunit IIA [Metabacillus fastidiosus]
MFKKMLKEGEEKTILEECIFAPLSGKLINIDEVPDPVFSEKMMGDGMAVEPTEGNVLAPVDGEVIQIFHAKHAIAIRSEGGAEILLHIGLETVSLDGQGFEVIVKEGEKVKSGDLLLTFDLPFIRENAASTISPIVITNGEMMERLTKERSGAVQAGISPMFRILAKS